ncbi:MAG: 4Fe-4S binding protein [Clostridia bacterium]|nr:4Fe-4S binding protein [Clostridia bacterium]
MAEILRLKKSNCRNCYKCIRNCPVQAIRFYGNQAYIANDMCVYCGQCFAVCPQEAQEFADSTEAVSSLLQGNETVVASVSSAFLAYYDGIGFDAVRRALMQLGFTDAEETARGAVLVKREYERILREGEREIILSSTCHAVNLLVKKYYPTLVHCLAPVISPMAAHARMIKEKMPQAKVVFVGPCLSAKDEAMAGAADAVLTFSELDRMLADRQIVMDTLPENAPREGSTRMFSVAGGILKSMACENETYTYMSVDGMDDCRDVLDEIEKGNISRCFIEMSACVGGCIGGPVMKKYSLSPIRHYQAVAACAGKADFSVDPLPEECVRCEYTSDRAERHEPSEEEIRAVLHQMGKIHPEQELNCGTCGYDSCREMAAAVCRGKADISMCQPYVMAKSEHFTNTILDNSPNGILVLNEDYEVQRINRAAMQMLHIQFQSDMLGQPVMNIMDPVPFMEVLQNKIPVVARRDYYAEYGIYLEQTILHDTTARLLLAFLRDVTAEETDRQYHERLLELTAETADKVVDKQMRIVQEIASLLGKTAAETKIALTKLKESMKHEQHEH